MEALAQIQDQLVLIAFDPWLWAACLAGVTLGILWGAMPGLSTTMAMTLLIGLAVGMSQYTAIMFILGVYTGSVFGGAISAVLVNIPGTPDAGADHDRGLQARQARAKADWRWGRRFPPPSWGTGWASCS